MTHRRKPEIFQVVFYGDEFSMNPLDINIMLESHMPDGLIHQKRIVDNLEKFILLKPEESRMIAKSISCRLVEHIQAHLELKIAEIIQEKISHKVPF